MVRPKLTTIAGRSRSSSSAVLVTLSGVVSAVFTILDHLGNEVHADPFQVEMCHSQQNGALAQAGCEFLEHQHCFLITSG